MTTQPSLTRLGVFTLVALSGVTSARAVTWSEVHPLLQTHCHECHNAEKDEGNFDIEKFRTEAELFGDFTGMEDMKWVVGDKEMPPMKADAQPTDEERKRIVSYLEQSLIALSNAKPEDPGVVPMPRVNPHQFDYIVEDLTGYDLNLGQYLTPDGASKEGFVHFGAFQTISVGQFEGFLSTAKKLLGYARVVPGAGMTWSPGPLPAATTEQKLKNSLLERWRDWHVDEGREVAGQHMDRVERVLDVDGEHWSFDAVLEAYFEAVWQYENRAALGMPEATIADIAAEYPVPLFPGSLEYARSLMLAPETLSKGDDYLENPVFWAYRDKFAAVPGPGEGDRFSRRDELRKPAIWREAAGSEFDGMFLGELTLRPEERADVQQLRGLFHRGTPRLDIDVASSTSGRVYLAVVPVFGSDWNPSLTIRPGAVRFKDGSKKTWSEALSVVDQDGAKVSPDEKGAIVLKSPGHLVIEPKVEVRSIHAEAEYAKSGSRRSGGRSHRHFSGSAGGRDPLLRRLSVGREQFAGPRFEDERARRVDSED